MNQKQFLTEGKGKLPLLILKWIWKNLDKIDDVIDLLHSLRPVRMQGEDKPDPGTTPPPP